MTQNWKNGLTLAFNRKFTFVFLALALHVSGIRLALLALALAPVESGLVNIPGCNRRIISRQNQPNRIVANKKKKNVAAAGDLTHEAAFATPPATNYGFMTKTTTMTSVDGPASLTCHANASRAGTSKREGAHCSLLTYPALSLRNAIESLKTAYDIVCV